MRGETELPGLRSADEQALNAMEVAVFVPLAGTVPVSHFTNIITL